MSVHDIKGIWVASDGKNVASEVKTLFAEFFPNVELERIVWISNRAVETTKDVPSDKPIPTRMNSMVRAIDRMEGRLSYQDADIRHKC